jgi:hypothetical protein
MATKFKIEHEFANISLDKFIAHLNDPVLNKMLQEGLKFKERKMLERQENDEGILWQFRVKKQGELPKPIQKIVKDDALAWIEKSKLVKKDQCIYWEILPESKVFRFHGTGVWRLSAMSRGCKRVIEGEIAVEIPLVGKMVESFIVSELLKTYEIEPLIQEKFYAQLD